MDKVNGERREHITHKASLDTKMKYEMILKEDLLIMIFFCFKVS